MRKVEFVVLNNGAEWTVMAIGYCSINGELRKCYTRPARKITQVKPIEWIKLMKKRHRDWLMNAMDQKKAA